MKNYKQFKTKLLKDRKILKAYEDIGPEFNLVRMIIQNRIKRGLTQKELARKIGTKQSAISRLESGVSNPTISVLRRVAEAMDARIEILIR
ncbi:MAG: transcriptional regulator [Candidatus Nealsonbacteria bacterium RIFCSPLOWO2_01_FULL_41_9]|uniref:Transcriptional regulator n=1 Tax=Candidatus Nealsonbacteria bacterium RIFCSPLOWO2_01_FULL_41_9 TaxID=1801671 RepID=A0A1G2EBK4_9BACT|nr:MAG: transcriptional regulator [Candidatus Nealsonbacteria bacterium RIFCSPLOWO2_01_FULL_41_9]